jgi:multidrug efflux pump
MLTLFTTPVIYLAFDRIARRIRRRPLDTPAYPLPREQGGPEASELPEGYQP